MYLWHLQTRATYIAAAAAARYKAKVGWVSTLLLFSLKVCRLVFVLDSGEPVFTEALPASVCALLWGGGFFSNEHVLSHPLSPLEIVLMIL